VASLTFNAAGTGNHNSAYSELALFETAGAAWTTRAAATQSAPNATGFATNAATFTLTSTAFPPGSTRRFFLLGKLNGTAIQNETYNARLESIVGTPPANGSTVGIPTADSTALVINSAVLTVGNGTPQPNASTHKAGVAAGFTLARFLLSAMNDNVTITGINLTTGGTGTWTTDVDNVQVFEDDGDGAFGASDTLLFQGAGAAVVTATFTTPLSMPVTSTTELWVRVNLSATAGIGATGVPETFNLSVAATTDVNASTPVILGTPAPVSVTVGAIEFEVTGFTPPNDLPAGGKAITISGKGFMSPFTVTIGGAVCPGTALITLNGTSVTGLTVPGGGGQGLPIVITSGTLAPQTITQTFSYGKVSDIGGSGGDSGGGGCSASGQAGWLALAILPLFVAIRRRKHNV
jgi:Synergist-CTERM protein sorting domain-containing protein